MSRLTYLDNNATTPLSPRALARLTELLAGFTANPSSPHALGRASRELLEQSRRTIAGAIGAPARLYFTASGTEANVLAIESTLRGGNGVEQLVVSELLHDSVYGYTEQNPRVPVVVCRSLANGHPDLDHLREICRARRSLVSTMHVNNETGVVFPVESIARVVRECDGVLHTDLAQSMGRIPVQAVAAASDLVTFAAHKFHGPLGVGGLAVMHAGLKLVPVTPGGKQEGDLRSGTINVPAIAATASAVEDFLADPRGFEELAALRDEYERAITHGFPKALIVARETARIWSTSYVCFPLVAQLDLIAALSARGVCVGRGAACTVGTRMSRGLRAMGVEEIYGAGAIRVSFGRTSTREDLGRLLAALPDAHKEALAQSPYGDLSDALASSSGASR